MASARPSSRRATRRTRSTQFTAAAKIRDAKPVDLEDRATTRFDLAKAYAASGDQARAIPLAEQAIDIFKTAGARTDDHRHEAETWLAAHTK